MRILVEIYGWVSALLLYAFFQFLRATCRIEIHDVETLRRHPHALWTTWHEFVICTFITFPLISKHSRPQVWLNHPGWGMRAVHRICQLYGIKVIMGASGAGGRESAAILLQHLKADASTCLNPDGPAGPQHQLKSGVIHLSQQTGLPILTFHYKLRRFWRWPGWDGKPVPFPFTRVDIALTATDPKAPCFAKSSEGSGEGDESEGSDRGIENAASAGRINGIDTEKLSIHITKKLSTPWNAS